VRVQAAQRAEKDAGDFGNTTSTDHEQEEASPVGPHCRIQQGVIEQIGTPNEVYITFKTELYATSSATHQSPGGRGSGRHDTNPLAASFCAAGRIRVNRLRRNELRLDGCD
jgi:ABC-type sugar transport system ATPase subunit